MVSFTINPKVMSSAGVHFKETFKKWHEMQRRDTTSSEN